MRYVVVCFFSFEWCQVRDGYLSSCLQKRDFFVKHAIEFGILGFDVIVNLEVNMEKLIGLFLEDSGEKVSDGGDIFPMHADEESTVRCLDINLNLLFSLLYMEWIDLYTELPEELIDDIKSIHINRFIFLADYTKNGGKWKFSFEKSLGSASPFLENLWGKQKNEKKFCISKKSRYTQGEYFLNFLLYSVWE